jgi:adenylate cyclase
MLRAVESSFVTIMFTDVVGSTTLYDRYGDDEADARRARHFAVLREVVAAHEGNEVKSTGDGLMVTFTSAVAAVRCAVEMQRATTGAADSLEVRMASTPASRCPRRATSTGRR